MAKTTQEILQGIGLSEREARIYLKMLSIGECTSGELIKETKMYKADIYEVAKKLIEKGLVSYVKSKGKIYYSPADPKKILDIVEDKKVEHEQKRNDVFSIMGELERKYGVKKVKREVTVLEGMGGIKTILIDAEKEKKSIYLLGASTKFIDLLAHRFPQWEKKREMHNMVLNSIWVDEPEARKSTRNRPLINARFISSGQISPFATWACCGNILGIFVFDEHPIIIRIKSKEIADSFRKYFDVIWHNSKE